MKTAAAVLSVWVVAAGAAVTAQTKIEYRVLGTNRTSTMERELNEAADEGYRLQSVMGGETAFGGSQVVAIMARGPEPKAEFQYRLLATQRTSTMERELQRAASAGYDYHSQTVFETVGGGREVVVILQRHRDREGPSEWEYSLLATSRTSTMERELRAAGNQGAEVAGMTVAPTALGGSEIVAILRRKR